MLQKLHNLSESAQGLHVVLIFEPLQITHQAPVVRKVDNAIRRINHYPVDSVVCFVNTYPLDSDLSSGERYPDFEQPGPDLYEIARGDKKISSFARVCERSTLGTRMLGNMVSGFTDLGTFSLRHLGFTRRIVEGKSCFS